MKEGIPLGVVPGGPAPVNSRFWVPAPPLVEDVSACNRHRSVPAVGPRPLGRCRGVCDRCTKRGPARTDPGLCDTRSQELGLSLERARSLPTLTPIFAALGVPGWAGIVLANRPACASIRLGLGAYRHSLPPPVTMQTDICPTFAASWPPNRASAGGAHPPKFCWRSLALAGPREKRKSRKGE